MAAWGLPSATGTGVTPSSLFPGRWGPSRSSGPERTGSVGLLQCCGELATGPLAPGARPSSAAPVSSRSRQPQMLTLGEGRREGG